MTNFQIYGVRLGEGEYGTIIVKDSKELKSLVDPKAFYFYKGSINSVQLAESINRITKREDYKDDLRNS